MPYLTIRETIDAGTEVRAYCSVDECQHHEALPLEQIGQQYGFDYPVSHDSLVPKLRCKACGSKKVTIRIHDEYRAGIKFDTHGKLLE